MSDEQRYRDSSKKLINSEKISSLRRRIKRSERVKKLRTLNFDDGSVSSHDSPSSSHSVVEFWRTFLKRHAREISTYKLLLSGRCPPPTFFLSRWLFLRCLGVVYGIAFVSLWIQIEGLIGRNGIFPVNRYLAAVWDQLGIVGYWTFPTFCWLSADNLFLYGLCGFGVLLSTFLAIGILPLPSLIGLWMGYLSLSTVCRTFLGYQWDTLLLEVGFLAILLSPNQVLPRLSSEQRPSKLIIWLFYWLLFRLMFSSGIVKLNSGDLSWRTLTALNYHYETQPIPNIIAWYVHQMPQWFQQLSVFGTLVIELGLPFFILGPRRLRLIAFFGTAFLQFLILVTGNYGFFNLLTITLCILLLDDAYLSRLFSKQIFAVPVRAKERSMTALAVSIITVAIVMPLSLVQMKARVFRLSLSDFEQRIYRWSAPYRSVNSYGLFATMTKSRPEIIIEGSNDGRGWEAYEFKWKPGKLARRPSQVAPHQPRVDWQMWFEGLNYLRRNKPTPWFSSFLHRLLEGEESVLNLLDHNPFGNAPPLYIRATVYDYQFTNFETKRRTGHWWKREYLGEYVKPLSKVSFAL